MSASALAQFGTKHIARGIGRLATEVIESGSGSYVTMVGGRKMVRTAQSPFIYLTGFVFEFANNGSSAESFFPQQHIMFKKPPENLR